MKDNFWQKWQVLFYFFISSAQRYHSVSVRGGLHLSPRPTASHQPWTKQLQDPLLQGIHFISVFAFELYSFLSFFFFFLARQNIEEIHILKGKLQLCNPARQTRPNYIIGLNCDAFSCNAQWLLHVFYLSSPLSNFSTNCRARLKKFATSSLRLRPEICCLHLKLEFPHRFISNDIRSRQLFFFFSILEEIIKEQGYHYH